MAATQDQVLIAVLDAAHSASLAQVLMQAGASVSLLQVRGPEQLLEQLRGRAPNLLVLELDREGTLLEEVRAQHPYLPVVAVLNRPTEKITFSISRLGAEDVWTLPIETDAMLERAQAVLERLPAAAAATVEGHGEDMAAKGAAGPPAIEGGEEFDPSMPLLPPPAMVGANPRMAEIRDTVEKVAATDVTVLIRGESGVGKEVIARLLFEYSRRRQKPFIKVNCAAIPHDLLESELFGYEAGAFTGATRDKPGKFEMANHGTLFLDEIAEMHPMLQAKLLHVLQDGTFSRLGAKRDIAVDVRVLCATNKLLEERVRDGLFREDLLYRINVVTIFLPPLRERRDEIPILTDYLLRKYSIQYGRPLHRFSPEVARRMTEYDWPGNIRELENLCKRFVIVGSETQILRELSSHGAGGNGPAVGPQGMAEGGASKEISPSASGGGANPRYETRGTGADSRLSGAWGDVSLLEIGRRAAWEAERRAILEVLQATRWNRREASRRLQVSYKALLNKIKQMQLEGEGTPEVPSQGEQGKFPAQ